MIVVDPCNPSPCGSNAQCREINSIGVCACLPDYFGDPYLGCQPECVTDTQCDYDEACINLHCEDPCIGTCGIGADCTVVNHNALCTCPPGYTGDAFQQCTRIPIVSKYSIPILLLKMTYLIGLL